MIKKITDRGIVIVSLIMIIYQLYYIIIKPVIPLENRMLHVMFSIVIMLMYAMREQVKLESNVAYVFFILITIVGTCYLQGRVQSAYLGLNTWMAVDYLAVLAIMVALFIACYHSVGLWLPVLAVFFILFLHYFPFFSNVISEFGMSWSRFMTGLFTDEGLYGSFVEVMSTYVFSLVLYSELFIGFGVADFLTEFAEHLNRKYHINYAFCSSIAGIIFGLFTVRSMKNVLNMGSRTGSRMKEHGYGDHYSGGLTAAIATSGKLMPPIFGPSALYMASKLLIPYEMIRVLFFALGILCIIPTAATDIIGVVLALVFLGILFIKGRREKAGAYAVA